ncbi:MAG: PIN domain-containing protein [Nanoarchaeota archaeon]
MLLVVDANVAFAAIISPEGLTNDLLFSPVLELIAPEFFEEEFKKYLSVLSTKAGVSEEEVQIAFNLILSRVKILPSEEYQQYGNKASEISPDPKDKEYFAVALTFNCPIWSNDKVLKLQQEVKVLSTKEVLSLVQR